MTRQSSQKSPCVPLLASWSPVEIAGGLHLVGLATDARQRRLSGWLTTGPVLELDFLRGLATTAPDNASYALGIRVGGALTPCARTSVAAMIAQRGLASSVPASALTTKELSAWTDKIRVVGATRYFRRLALFEVL